MPPSVPRICSSCGAALPTKNTASQCVRCLLGVALETPAADAKSGAAHGEKLPRSFGGYELLEEISRGGMGVVFKARQRTPNRIVALKMVRGGDLASEAELARFRNEAEAAGRLVHPNIVSAYEMGEHEGQLYFTMRLVEGRSLEQHLTRFSGDHRTAATLMVQVARAIQHAHERGILHRDMKPSNIVFDEEDQPHITDFGLAKLIEADTGLTLSGTILGTPAFIAPEQAAGRSRELTTAADVYSLGAVLYALLTGRPPFTGDSTVEILRKVVEEEPAPPSRCATCDLRLTNESAQRRVNRKSEILNPIDRDLDVICLKCLEKDPKQRYGSAQALAEDLERWLRHEPILARCAGPVERLAKWARRHPAVALLSAIVIAVFVAGITGVLWQYRRARANALRAERGASENLERLRRVHLANGRQRLETGDGFAAMLSFTEAFALDAARPDREQNHRTSLATVETEAPRLLQLWFPGGWVRHAEFSADGNRLLLVSDGEGARVFDLLRGQPLTPPLPHDGHGVKARLSADGRTVLSVAGGTARVWKVDGGTLIRQFPGLGVRSADLTPDGKRTVLLTHSNDFLIRDTVTGESIAPPYHAASGWLNIRIGSDGQRLVGFADEDFEVVNIEPFRPITRLRRRVALREERLQLMSFNGRRVVSIEADNTVVVRDASDGRAIGGACAPPEAVGHAVLSEDGRRVATSGDDFITRIWEAETGKMIGQLPRPNAVVLANAFSPDARRVVCHSGASGEEVRVWDIATARPLTPPLRHGGFVSVAVFSPDGRRFLTGAADGTARLWSLVSKPSDSGSRRTAFLSPPRSGRRPG